MQPTLPQQTGGIADMDLTAVQSMDWLFKKERIYLLAQFWQQRATLAEKEVNTLKEQLSSNCTELTTATSTQSQTNSPIICQELQLTTAVTTTAVPISTTTTTTSLKNYSLSSSPTKLNNLSSGISINIPSPPPSQNNINIHHQQLHRPQYQLQNGGLLAEAPSPSPPLSDSGSNTTPATSTKNSLIVNSNCNHSNSKVNSEIFSLNNNNNKMADTNDSNDSNNLITNMTSDQEHISVVGDQQQIISVSQTDNNNTNHSGEIVKEISSHSPQKNIQDEINKETRCRNNNQSTCTSDKSNNDNNNLNNMQNNNNNNNNSNNNNSSRKKSLTEELAAKDKEIKILMDEVSRLLALHEQNILEIQKLKQNLNGKIQLISNLESQLQVLNVDTESKLSTIKEEKNDVSPIASPIPTTVATVCADPKKFQDIFLERTKILAANQQHNDKKQIYNTEEPTESLNIFTSNEINKKYTNTYNCSSPEPSSTIPTISLIESSIDYLSDTPNFKSNTKENNNSNNDINELTSCTDINKIHVQNLKASDDDINKINIISERIKDPNNELNSSNENFHNVEQFGTILGEELIKKYWRRNFDLPNLVSSNHSLTISPNENIQGNTHSLKSSIIDDGVLTKVTPLSEVATTTNKTPVLSPYQNIIPTTSTLGPSSTALLSQLVNSTFTNSLRTDNICISSNNNSHNPLLHQDMDKSSGRNSTSSTPNLHDGRHSSDDHNTTGGISSGILNPLSMNKNNCNEENTLGSLTHMHGNFLPNLPFQFQDRNHFRFSDDIQMSGSMTGRLGESLIPKGDPMEAKLQEMLRYNMDKYANQNLDTLHISRRVRELLSVHNIGQRLFAKYVLGLSQGTVSELLSKPKPWDKLTEKGRDSYRKMHAWACDDTAVLLLKSLIPKKGSDPGMPQYSRSDESMSDDRIAHILSEASQMLKNPTSLNSNIHQQPPHMHQQFHQQHNLIDRECEGDDLNSNEDSKSPIHRQCQSPPFKDNPPRQRKDDDISQDKITKIYHEELAKIMSRSQRESFPSGGVPPNLNTQQIPDENIRVALEAYHRELSKLQQTGGNIPNFPNLSGLLALQHQAGNTLNGSAQDLSISKEKEFSQTQEQYNGQLNCSIEQSDQNTKDSVTSEDQRHSSAFSLVRPKQEPSSQSNNCASSVGTPSAAASPLGNSILPPAMTPTEDFSSAASPLQRMASITNSLITQPPITPHHSQPQRPMKAVLPPITQQQFDMFNNLNTEDIVRRVKEALSQYSISQRLFGESVLGLSQGSVSDLLARPKPWHMLTQKGREPFIRMKMFLEDDNAVHKLVASQYKIAPEKLMRTGNYSGSPQIPTGLANKMGNMGNMSNMGNLPMQKIMNELKLQENTPHQHIMQQMQASVLAHIPTSQHQGMLLTPPGMPPHHAISLSNSAEKKPMMIPVQSPQQNNAMRGMHQHMSPTVYEMAALTQDLDTQIITTKIKEALLANNIGQKIFGEAVLGLSQGSVSELLSKPKPWHMLSIKGREPFIRMQLWLSDGNNVERLQVLKNERREASKRRRSIGPAGNHDNSSDTSSNDTADFYTSSPGPGSVGSTGAPPNKKQRVLFSEEQKEALRLAFALDPYPNVATIEFLANELNLATRTITNWFHNHRMRLKQQVPHGAPTEPMPSRENPPATPFDPVQFRILLNQRLVELQKDRMGISGIPIPYPPYFSANPNLAALIGRGLLPTNQNELKALNAAFREQMNGLDLSMGSTVKRERDDEFDDDVDGENDNDISDSESLDGDGINKSDNNKDDSFMSLSMSLQSRTSRRKPAAPQWVNPDWQEGTTGSAPVDLAKIHNNNNNKNDKEVIINGVCVMQQADDYSKKNNNKEHDELSSISSTQIIKDPNDILGNGGNEIPRTDDTDTNISVEKYNDTVTTVDEIRNSSIKIKEAITNKSAGNIDDDNNSEEFSINEKTNETLTQQLPLKREENKNSDIWKY